MRSQIFRFLSAILIMLGMSSMTGCSKLHITTFDNLGSYPPIFKPKGQDYKSVGYRWDYESYALIYIYRPATDWALDEVEAPSFNVNDHRLFNFKGGAYTWYEAEPGNYNIKIRRGIFGIEGYGDINIRTYTDFDLEVEAGKVYYLRYSEIDPIDVIETGDGKSMGDGPLQVVSHALADKEMRNTKLHHHGRELLLTSGETTKLVTQVADAPGQKTITEQRDYYFYEETTQGEDGGTRAAPKTEEQSWWPF